MDLARNCSFLALVVFLSGAVGGMEDGGSDVRTFCDVIEDSGQDAKVNCGLEKCERFASWNETSITNDSIVKYTYDGLNSVTTIRTFQRQTFKHETINGVQSDNFTRNFNLSDHNFDSNKTNAELVGNQTSQLNKKDTKHNCTRDNNTEVFHQITTLHINLLTSSMIVNLSSFPNANIVCVTSGNLTILRICGAENISQLSIVSTQLKNTSFMSNLKKMKKLSITHSILETSFVADLPPSVAYLNLTYNNITLSKNVTIPKTIKSVNFSHSRIKFCNDLTIKGNVISLDFSRNSLVRVPNLNLESIEDLYLSYNNISVLRYGDFSYLSTLINLDLKENNLVSLESKVFEGLNKLQNLDLSQNKISVLAPALFQYLTNLLTLSISGNTNLGKLQDTEDGSFLFGTGQRLQNIEACKTNLTRIPSTLTRSVRKLQLKNNQISSVQCGEMDSYPLIQEMDLSHNVINEVEEDALGRLDFLSDLVLHGNKLTNVPKSLPNQLQILDLSLNFIKILHNYDFLGLQRLKVLLISRNQITHLEDGTFGQLTSLEVLDLSFNPIKALSRTSFIGPRKLREMYLVSLTDLISFQEPLSFPAPESAHLEVLNIESSPVLATQLMDDAAALTMFHELYELNLNNCSLSNLRNDLPKYLPRLHKLKLSGNRLNCTNIVWLLRWLQTLNISRQDKGNPRKEIYTKKEFCRDEVDFFENYDEASVICSSPDYLSGRQIISLKEEDFPDLKLTSSPLPPREVLVTKPYQTPTFPESERSTIDLIDSSLTTSSSQNLTESISEELLIKESTKSYTTDFERTTVKPESNRNHFDRKFSELRNKSSNNSLEKLNKRKPSPSKSATPRNQTSQFWRYSRNESSSLPQELAVVLLNESSVIRKDIDNHLNDSVSSDAFLSVEPVQSSHPGMVLFLLVVGLLVISASFMVYSQCSESRHGRDYHPQQDMEISSLGGNDLW